jgi:hypothetical protein
MVQSVKSKCYLVRPSRDEDVKMLTCFYLLAVRLSGFPLKLLRYSVPFSFLGSGRSAFGTHPDWYFTVPNDHC